MAKATPEDVELIKAAKKGDLAAVKKALAAGGSPAARKSIGEYPKVSALHMAVLSGKPDVVKALLDAKAPVDIGDEDDSSPLLYACGHLIPVEKISIDIVKLLLEHGASVKSHPDSTGCTPLHEAARWKQLEIAKLLITKGADVNASYDQGTPLKCAATDGNPVFQLLLDHGADWKANRNGWTLLHSCINNRAPELAREVWKMGGDPDAVYTSPTDGEKSTPRSLLKEARDDDPDFPDIFQK